MSYFSIQNIELYLSIYCYLLFMDVRSGERAATDDNLFNHFNLFTLHKQYYVMELKSTVEVFTSTISWDHLQKFQEYCWTS